MAFLPIAMAAVGAYQGLQKSNADKYNASVMGGQKNVSIDQANAQAGMVQRSSMQRMEAQKAAFGAAGVGYGGSSAGSLDQSLQNTEMDALNTRYKGTMTSYGYGQQASQDNAAATQDQMTAGAALLKGIGSNYSYTPQTQAYNPQSGSG